MPSVKVTIFQKKIDTVITSEQKNKIIAQKSDFLILPDVFPYFESDAKKTYEEREKKYIDILLEISEYYKGVIIGSTILKKRENKFYLGCPIVKDFNLIDWYDRRDTNIQLDEKIQKGDSEKNFILDGVRFSILIGNEIENSVYLEEAKNENIELIINPYSIYKTENEESDYKKELDSYYNISKKYGFEILRISGLGAYKNSILTGRSLYSSKSGVKWKVAPIENTLEIIKTVNITLTKRL